MRQLFYLAVQHQALLKTLLVLGVITAMVIAVGTPEVALADVDGFDP